MRVDLGFLAPPGDLADWRMVLVADLADKSGLLDALPAPLKRWRSGPGYIPSRPEFCSMP